MGDHPSYSDDAYIPVSNVASNEFAGSSKKQITVPNKLTYQAPPERLCFTTDDPPWKLRSYSNGAVGLHEEIEDFYEIMRPKKKEIVLRLKVIEHITRVVRSLWPYAQVEVFGSFRTGLYLPSSDIDMVVIGEWRNIPLSTLSSALEKNGISNADINIIANATVPIIRMLHTPSQIRVDISFNMTNGVKSAKLIKSLVKKYPVLPKLLLVLKQFLVYRNLNEVYNGGMSSYCLTLLIVSFLQGYQKPKGPPSTNLGTLLLEFFELYGLNFNYEKVSIHFQGGGYYRRRYKTENLLSVEDPLVEGHDVAKGTYLMNLLKISFQNAFHVLSQAVFSSAAQQISHNSFLQEIFKVEDSIVNNRETMMKNHDTISRTLTDLFKISTGPSAPYRKSGQNSNPIQKAKRKKS